MADQNKFEEMLERLINEDKAGAEELFHEIVVEKSRNIYESLLESDLEDLDEADDEAVDEATDEEVDESDDEDLDEADDEAVDEATDEEVEEGFDLGEFEVEADDEPEMPGMDMDDEGDDDEGEDGDMEDRVMDLEDALDDLKAEFEKMMDGDDEEGDDEEGGDAVDDMMNDVEDEAIAFESDEEVEEASDEEVEEATDEEVEEGKKSAGETMREYVEKVSATMGDTSTNGTKSAVAGKNDMGGTAGNLNQSAVAGDPEAGAGSTVKGNALSDTSSKEDSAGNVNVPGGKAAKAGSNQPGHGAEKKGKPETAANKKPTIGG